MTVCAPEATAVSAEPLFRLGLGFRAAKAMQSAVELGVFAELASGPLDGTGLAARLGLHARSARDFLDALVALELLDRDDDGAYHNTSVTDAFLVPGEPSYVGAFFEMASARLYPSWGSLTAARHADYHRLCLLPRHPGQQRRHHRHGRGRRGRATCSPG